MQRGARITLAAVILIAGAAAAMLFRRDKPAGDPAPIASGEPSGFQSPAGDSHFPRPIAPHPVRRIEFAEHSSDDAGGAAVAAFAPMVALPPTTGSAERDEFSTENRPATSTDSQRTHKIRDGDTLSELARRYLGRRERFIEIFEANRDKLASPDLLPIGKELRIPPVDQTASSQPTADGLGATPPSETADAAGIPTAIPGSPGVIRPANGPPHPPRTYRVQNEETLVQVSERVYGNAERYRDLYEANRDRLDSPQNLRPGTILVVP